VSAVHLHLHIDRARVSRRSSSADELRDLARQVLRIHDPYRTDPEATLIAKHDIAARLRRLADRVEG